MVDFGDEFVVQNYGFPWLMLIQILVLFLLFLVIYFAAVVSTCDLDQLETAAAGGSACPSELLVSGESMSVVRGDSSRAVINLLQVGGIEGEIVSNTRRRIVGGEDALERTNSSTKEPTSNFLHPCQYLRWARLAFLKCLGLDPDETYSSAEQRKES